MELRYALLSDFANVTQDGKLNVIGILDHLYSIQFPTIHRQLYMVTSTATDLEDEDTTREIHVQLINADGEVLQDLKGQVNFARGKQIFNQVHIFQDLVFNQAGPYQFNIFFDGRMVKTLELELQQLTVAQA
ncbi:MAG TPA: hypothetical protein VGL56_11605 [Fimbriimonadaceae bacterium]|jgi:hypothetical protein